jgi:V/A-type H+-transporting ATPase subunit A
MSTIVGTIERINGSLIVAQFDEEPKIGDLTEVGDLGLMGEIVRLSGETAYIQCFEATSGLRPGEPVKDIGVPLVAELGPGLMGRIVDGVERSETELWELTGPFVSRGTNITPLNREAKWKFEAKVKPGDKVEGGNVIGVVQETASFEHRVMVPPDQSGTIKSIKSGEFIVEDVIGELETSSGVVPLKMMQTWPVRIPRPIKERLPLEMPLMTGQRVIDTFFPVAKGGAAAIPGGFGTGKTVTLQQVAKWSDADIIIYIGCGERGNEMADVVAHFPELEDPRSGRKLIERTVIIANVSNMPVSAREASIYMGVTIGEFYRDMGYDVAIMADSTSRWAEALRDISGRLEEIPAEAGFPAYLSDRIAQIYERTGRGVVMGEGRTLGSLTLIGAVSPPGGDFSEPVTTHTLRSRPSTGSEASHGTWTSRPAGGRGSTPNGMSRGPRPSGSWRRPQRSRRPLGSSGRRRSPTSRGSCCYWQRCSGRASSSRAPSTKSTPTARPRSRPPSSKCSSSSTTRWTPS